MTGSNTVTTVKKGGKGKPFEKGDSRINRHGQISKKRIEFNKNIRDLLITEGESESKGKDESGKIISLRKVEWLIKSVWQKAIKGESWAVNFIAERTEGKITQPISGEMKVVHNFKAIMTEFFVNHGTCTVEEFVTRLGSINGGGNGGEGQKLLAESIKTILPAKPDRSPQT